jgi:hypothetical protein
VKRVVMRRRGEDLVLHFEYDRALVAAVKSLPKRRFDPSTREWVVPLYHYMDAISVMEAAGAAVEMDEDVKQLFEEGAFIPPEKPEVVIGRCGAEYVVQFEYEPALVKVAKSIPGRSFDPVSKAWFVPIEDEEGTLNRLLEAFGAVNCSIRIESKLKSLAPIQ